jgi:hypothetical protein
MFSQDVTEGQATAGRDAGETTGTVAAIVAFQVLGAAEARGWYEV